MRQVTHALLTRPPLSHKWITRRIIISASLDLHVLSTPPAFILSQDQNLAWLIFYPVSFTLVLFFKNYILLNFQGYVTVQLSRFFVFRCSSATFISYHVRFSLSRTFLTFFEKFLFSRTSFEHLRRSSLRRWLSYHPFRGMSTPFFEIFHIF